MKTAPNGTLSKKRIKISSHSVKNTPLFGQCTFSYILIRDVTIVGFNS